MELNDLLTGVENGLSKGLDAYTAARERQQRERASQAGLLQKGMLVGDSGQVQYTPEMQAQHAYQTNTFNPNTPESQRSRTLAKGLLKVANPQVNTDEIITPDMSAHEIENNPFINKTIQGSYGMQGRQITADRTGERNKILAGGLGERIDNDATKAGQAFEKDPIISQGKKTSESLNRALNLMDGDEPLTAKSFNIVQQDLINALAPGGAATEGKVNREMVETVAAKLNELKLKFGNVSDLRKEQPEVFNNLRNIMHQIHEDYADAMERQAKDIHESYSVSDNPKVKAVIDKKLQRYSKPSTRGVTGKKEKGLGATSPLEDQAALKFIKDNPNDPRSEAIKQHLKQKGL